jgi:hypothetical protein
MLAKDEIGLSGMSASAKTELPVAPRIDAFLYWIVTWDRGGAPAVLRFVSKDDEVLVILGGQARSFSWGPK